MGELSGFWHGRSVVVAVLFVAAAGALGTALALRSPDGEAQPGVVVSAMTLGALVVASGLFLVAGMLRLARWRLTADQHSALVGTALVLMGGVCLPIGGLGHALGGIGDYLTPGARLLVSLVCMGLVLLSLSCPDLFLRRSGRLPLVVATLITVVLVLLLAGGALAPRALSSPAAAAITLAFLRAVGWFVVSIVVNAYADRLPWARLAAPVVRCTGSRRGDEGPGRGSRRLLDPRGAAARARRWRCCRRVRR